MGKSWNLGSSISRNVGRKFGFCKFLDWKAHKLKKILRLTSWKINIFSVLILRFKRWKKSLWWRQQVKSHVSCDSLTPSSTLPPICAGLSRIGQVGRRGEIDRFIWDIPSCPQSVISESRSTWPNMEWILPNMVCLFEGVVLVAEIVKKMGYCLDVIWLLIWGLHVGLMNSTNVISIVYRMAI